MRRLSHITPRYIKARLALRLYEAKNPHSPWLTAESIRFLNTWLLSKDVGLEFGSGRSTTWFASRVSHLISVEHDAKWYRKVANDLSLLTLSGKVRYLLHEDGIRESAASGYVRVVSEIQNDSLDFCLVDGVSRDHCAISVIPKIRPGGVIIIDNVNWYLPCNSHAPNSRSRETGCASRVWEDFYTSIRPWRHFWTSDGVTDTAIFFKPT